MSVRALVRLYPNDRPRSATGLTVTGRTIGGEGGIEKRGKGRDRFLLDPSNQPYLARRCV